MIGANSALFQYSVDSDVMTTGRQLDFGVARTFAAKLAGQPAIGITTITRSTGGIATCSVGAAGTGYHVGDVLTCTTGGTGGLVRVETITPATGAVLTVSVLNPGSGYSATTSSTTVVPAGGTGCTISISSVTDIAVATTGTTPHNFKQGDTVTIAGAVEAGYNGAQTLLSAGFLANGTVNAFTFIYATTGLAGNATALAAQSATVLVDATQNWQPDELIGCLIQIQPAGPNQAAVMRRITDNTATTITVALAWTAPVSATTKYAIFDIKALGTESTFKTVSAKQPWGFASGGSNTTLQDSSKNWGVNEWAGHKVRIVAGTGYNATNGAEFVITSNDATTLTVAAFGFTPDGTTAYEVMDNYGVCTGGTATTLVDSTQSWQNTGTYGQVTGKRVKITAGANVGTEYTITGATGLGTLTYASGVVVTADNTYAVLGVNTRSTGTSLIRVNGTCTNPARRRNLISFRGGATPTIDRYDIAANVWDVISQIPLTETLTTGSMYCYNNQDRIYFTKESTGRLYYYDIAKNIIVPVGTTPQAMSTAILGDRMFVMTTDDLASADLEFVYLIRHTAADLWRVLVFA